VRAKKVPERSQQILPTAQSWPSKIRATKTVSVQRLWKNDAQEDRLKTSIISYIGGFLIRKWKKKHDCKDCYDSLTVDSPNNIFFAYKQFADASAGLQRPSSLLVKALCTLEDIFMANYSDLFPLPFLLKRLLQISFSVPFAVNSCHPELRDFLFRHFLFLRIHHQCKLLTQAVKNDRHKCQKKAKHVGIIAANLRRRSINILNKKR
jgi:hypothetical protein